MSWLPKGFEFLAGAPEAARKRWQILALQAYFDDSGSLGSGRWMVIAGLFGEAQLLASVADEWSLALSEAPAIPFFKMDHAVRFKGKFYGRKVSTRDAKVRRMASVIDRADLLEIYGRQDLEAFERISARWNNVGPTPGQDFHPLEQPYLNLAIMTITLAVTEAVERGATEPIKIVFDEQSLFRPSLQNAYNDFRMNGEDDPKRLAVMPVQIDFENDERLVILQAADLIAGDLRLAKEADPRNPEFIGHLLSKIAISHHSCDITDKLMEEQHAHTVRFISEQDGEALAIHKLNQCDD